VGGSSIQQQGIEDGLFTIERMNPERDDQTEARDLPLEE
jgi:hypothetical protein